MGGKYHEYNFAFRYPLIDLIIRIGIFIWISHISNIILQIFFSILLNFLVVPFFVYIFYVSNYDKIPKDYNKSNAQEIPKEKIFPNKTRNKGIGLLFSIIYPIAIAVVFHIHILSRVHWGWYFLIYPIEFFLYIVYIMLTEEFCKIKIIWVANPHCDEVNDANISLPNKDDDLSDEEKLEKKFDFYQIACDKLTAKSEAYISECSILCAIAFTVFHKISLDNPFNLNGYGLLDEFLINLGALVNDFTFENLTNFFGQSEILTIIMIFSFFSTLCFLLVIMSRLNYSWRLNNVKNKISNANKVIENDKINSIEEIGKLISTINIIIRCTGIMRTLALIMFLIVTLLSAYLVDSRFGSFFTIFSISAILFYVIYTSVKLKGIYQKMESNLRGFINPKEKKKENKTPPTKLPPYIRYKEWKKIDKKTKSNNKNYHN